MTIVGPIWMRGVLRHVRIAVRRQWSSYVLRRLISGQRVLIIGSGPSARDLQRIPEDVLVFGCNLSPRALLYSSNSGRVVDLYLGNTHAFDCYGKAMLELLETIRVRWYLSRNPRWARRLPGVAPGHALQDRTMGAESYFLERLEMDKAAGVREILKSGTPRTSTGVALLLLALFYGAREVSLIGIDLDSSPYAFQPGAPEAYPSHHSTIDHAVVALCALRYEHIFCASAHSPLTRLFPYRSLEAVRQDC